MKTMRFAVLAGAVLLAAPLAAQEHGEHAAGERPAGEHAAGHEAMQHDGPMPFTQALAGQLRMAEQKFIALAEAMPDERWDWRPGEGVRSVGEVFLHVAADNYFLPAVVGVAAPAETGITGDDYNSAVAYETRAMSRAETLAALRASFEHLQAALAGAGHEELHASYPFFGNEMTGIAIWIAATTHLHEHLGQSIAYARTNGVTPPWSN